LIGKRTIDKERIIRVVLNNPEGNLTKYRVAKLSACPWPSTYRILKQLEEVQLVRGTKVEKFKDLVLLWKNWKVKYDVRDYMVKDPLNILRQINSDDNRERNLQYALTTYQAENLIQNYLFPSRTDFYIRPEDKQAWHKVLLEAGALVGKGNVRTIIACDPHVFYRTQTFERLDVVSLPQLIVDLYREGGVCVEAADNLLEKVVKENVV
jgi:hypothetical protein